MLRWQRPCPSCHGSTVSASTRGRRAIRQPSLPGFLPNAASWGCRWWPMRAKRGLPTTSGRRSTSCRYAVSITGCARPTIPSCSVIWPIPGCRSPSAPSPTPGSRCLTRWPTTMCCGCWSRGSASPSTPTIPPTSVVTWGPTLRRWRTISAPLRISSAASRSMRWRRAG